MGLVLLLMPPLIMLALPLAVTLSTADVSGPVAVVKSHSCLCICVVVALVH